VAPREERKPEPAARVARASARAIREESKDSKELWEFVFAVMRGQLEGASLPDRMEPMKWLAAGGFGKVPEAVDMANDNADADELEAAMRVLDAMSPEETPRAGETVGCAKSNGVSSTQRGNAIQLNALNGYLRAASNSERSIALPPPGARNSFGRKIK
jgi:hypothetical protein